MKEINEGIIAMTYLEQLDDSQQMLIRKHLNAVIDWNEKVNLTRIDDESDGYLLHVEDSLSALPEFNDAPEGKYGDIGSGGGYPGIPLAIASGRETVLIDARKKKMDVVASIVEDLGLKDRISTYAGRAELLARQKPESFAVITARALAKLPVLMELASPLLMRNGELICYKSQLDEQELKDAKRVQKATGMVLKTDREFVLGDDITRRILVFRKELQPKRKLPRQEGMAQKNPL